MITLKKFIFISLVFLITFDTSSQGVYFGIPNKEAKLKRGDIIILGFHWSGSYTQFTDASLNQIKELDSILSNINKFKIEVGVHFNYTRSKSFNKNTCEGVKDRLRRLMITSNKDANISFICYGGSQPITNFNYYEKLYQDQINSRVEVKIK